MFSTIRIMAECMDKPPRPGGTQPKRDPAPKATVLLVDDDEPVRRLISTFLSLSGFRVLAAENGPKALAIWQEHKEFIDLLLTDMTMPEGISGLDLAERLQAQRPDLRVLFTSGYDADIVGEDGVLRAGLHFLQKPYRPEQLLVAVQATLADTPNSVQSVC
jgi:two-component system cell cycle sensor histidine kinase/response regulator CckA